MEIKEFLSKLEKLNFSLAVENGKLNLKGKRNAVSKEEIEAVKNNSDIIDYIRNRKDDLIKYISLLPQIPSDTSNEAVSIYRLSSLQEGMLFHSLYNDRQGDYIEQFICDLKNIDIKTFIAGWTEVTKRHSALRTAFFYDSFTIPVQRVYNQVNLPYELVDLRAMDTLAQNQHFNIFLLADRKAGFDFKSPPLMRFNFFRLSDNSYRMLWSSHHMLFDGWSIPILLREVLDNYEALLNGQHLIVPAEDRYEDHIHYLEKRNKWAEEAYWRKYLDRIDQGTTLPFIKKTVDTDNSTTLSITKTISIKTSAFVHTYAKNNRITVNTLMQGVWSLLLNRYTNTSNVLFGVVVSGRPDELLNVEQRVGLYINTIPFRATFNTNQEIPVWLQQLQGDQVASRNHQHAALHDIAQWTGVKSNLFDTLLVFENYPVGEALAKKSSSIEIDNIRVHEQTNYPLTILIADAAEIKLSFNYKQTLLNADEVAAIAEHFEFVLQQIVEGAVTSLNDVSLITPHIKSQLDRFNDTDSDAQLPENLVAMFEEQVNKTPNGVAVAFWEEMLCYRSLNAQANQLARHLQLNGVGAETLVPICLERSLEMLVGIIAILKVGAAYVPVDPDYPQERIAFVFSDTGAPLVLCNEASKPKLNDANVKLIVLDSDWGEISLHDDSNLDVQIESRQLAYVIYTSGSTGIPKGAMNEHCGIVNRLIWTQQYFGLTEQDVVLQKTTFSFDVSVWELLWPVLAGAKLVFAKPGAQGDSDYLRTVINNEAITLMHFVPSMLHVFLLDIVPGECPTLKNVLCSGEALTITQVELFREKLPHVLLHNLYGPTEAAIDVTYWTDVDKTAAINVVPIGRPLLNTHIYIKNPYGQLCPVGVPGELYIGGVQVARGYLNRDELTRERFISDKYSLRRDGQMYRTGDLARWLPDGNIEYLGRMDDQVKIRGFRIELGEIENVILQSGSVQQAVVLTTEDELGDKKLVAYVVAHNYDKEQLVNHLRSKLPDYMIPQFWVHMDSLPITLNGKLDKKALPKANTTEHLQERFVAPRDEIERKVAIIWQNALGVDKVGIYDNFFELGGHSLLAMRVVMQIRRELSQDLSIEDLFNSPCIADLFARSVTPKNVAPQAIPLQARPKYIPLSFSQERLWFIDRLEGSVQYHLPAVLKLTGHLDIAALERALGDIVSRHEVLRTVIKEHEGTGYQFIKPPGAWHLKQTVAAGITDMVSYIDQCIKKPFNLSVDDMLRAELIVVNDESYVLVITVHHIVSDGWSAAILVEELIEMYAAISQNREVSLKSLPIQYADYSLWQRNSLNDAVLTDRLSYWKTKLEGIATLKMPTDRNKQSDHVANGQLFEFLITPDQSAQLQALSLQHGVTLYMTLLAVFNILLYRYSGQDDICVGAPVANRDNQETENLIGFFVNTLALRNQVKGDQAFTVFLAQVRKTMLEAYHHKDVPFEKVVEAVIKERDLMVTPLFQVMFVLQNTPQVPQLQLGDLTLSVEKTGEFTSQFDLSFNLQETDSGIRGVIEYNAELYNVDTMQRMAGHYAQLLNSVVNDPEESVGKLKMLSDDELLNLKQINDTFVAYPQGDDIVKLFEKKAAQTPDATAIVFEGIELSYKELNERANQLAHYLQDRGGTVNTIVPICIERGLHMIIAILGVLKAGAAYVPVDIEYPNERVSYMLADVSASVIIGSNQSKTKLAEYSQTVVINGIDAEAIAIQPIASSEIVVDHNRIAYVNYTSGSTGNPKGVMVTHGNILNYCLGFIDYFNVTANDVVLQQSSISFDTMCEEIYPALITGAKIILVKDGGRDIDAVENFIINNKVSLISATPTLIAYLNKSLQVPDTLRCIIIGGEKLQPHCIDNLIRQVSIANTYGPTETTVCATYHMVNDLSSSSVIGRPVTNTQVYIVNKDGELAPVGVPGEIYIGGAQVSRGYIGMPALTAEKFIADRYANVTGGRLYRTGDIGRLLPNGTIDFIGRADDQVKIRGYRVELGEIESALRRNENVLDTAVLARPDKNNNNYLTAYVVPRGRFEKDDIIAYLKNILPDHMIPQAWMQLDVLPLMTNGKIDKRALPEIDLLTLSTVNYVAPRNEIEIKLAQIWKELLALESVGIYDNFFELGGHSLLAMRVIAQIRRKLNVEVAIRDMFMFPKIADLAKNIQHGQLNHQLVTKAPRPNQIPLSYSQERLWFIDRLEGSKQYHLSGVLNMVGNVNISALERAIQHIVDRHEVLRTVIKENDGRGYQYIKPKDRWFLGIDNEIDNLSDDTLIRAHVNELIDVPFDLSKDNMLRGTLIRLTENSHLLVMVMHHIASDAWSIPVLVNEMATLYNAYCNNEEITLPALPLQFADYAIWQRDNIREEQLEEKLNYWRSKLQDVPVLQLPADYSRPVGANKRGATKLFTIDKELSGGLQLLSREQGVTLYMTLLSAFNVLLYNYSGQEDICVGTSIAGRPQPELEALIGFFVNTLAFRNHVNGNEEFTKLLAQVKETTLQAYDHQEVPFEKVVEAVVKERTAGVSPLFQVMLVLGNTPSVPQLKLGELKLNGFEHDHSASKFDLTFFVTEADGGLLCAAQYNTDIYTDARIERMIVNFKTLLASIVAAPATPVGKLNMLPLQQIEQLLQIGHSAANYPEEKTVADVFENIVFTLPDSKALVFEGSFISYNELNSRANRLAHHLIRQGVKANVLVPLYAERGLDMVSGILGILKAGGAYVPIDTDLPRERVKHVLEDTGARIAVSSSLYAGELAAITDDLKVIELDELDWSLLIEPDTDPERHLSVDDAAYVIYTSGSTGNPKGVMVTHRNLVDYVYGLDQRIQISSCTTFALVSTIATDLGNTVLYSSLFFGGALHIFTKETTSHIEAIHNYFDQHRIDCVKIVPSHWAALSVDTPLLPARMIVFGGEVLTGDIVSKIRRYSDIRVINHYGPTETTIGKLLYKVTDADTGNIPIGMPFSNTRTYVLNKNVQLCPIGVPGELYIGGTGVATGYYNKPELTNERFLADPFTSADGRVYRTGDLVQYRADGNIEYLGRIDDQIKIRGYRVEPDEVRRTLERNESVERALVLSRKDQHGNNQLVAYVIVKGVFDRYVILSFLKEQLAEHMVPAFIIEINEIPLTAAGKIDRRALPNPEFELTIAGNASPANETEVTLSEIWKDVLELDAIGVNDDFFELGGHSLLAVRLVSSVRKAFAIELPISDVFDNPTISKLAARIVSKDDNVVLPEVSVQTRPQYIPLSFSQERIWFIDKLEGSTQYHIPSVLQVTGKIDIAALNFAFGEIVNRHEVLRTVVKQYDGQGYQFVTPKDCWNLKVTAIDAILSTGLAVQDYLRQQINKPFNLEQDHMMRAELIVTGGDKYTLLVTIHHIASDGWSTSILVKELASLYNKYVSEPDNLDIKPLEKLPLQYADFAIWQRTYLSGDLLDDKLAYWKNKLADPTVLHLPVDRKRPMVVTNNGSVMPVIISKQVSGQLSVLGKKANTTLYMTLLAAFKVLLYRYSGQDDIIVGTPVSGRNSKEVEGMIGFFINTLVLRSNVSGDDTFLALLEQIRTNTLEAYHHQDVPFEKIVEAVVKERDISRSPLFQVMFVLQNTPPIPELRLGDVSLSPIEVADNTAKFDISLNLIETSDGIRGGLEYNTDIFDASTIKRIIGNFNVLLEQIVLHPEQPVGKINILTYREREEQLHSFNDNDVEHPVHLSIAAMFEAQAIKTPDSLALAFGDTGITYRELNNRANQLARYLIKHGVQAETLVPVCIERGTDMIVAIMAILKAGAAYVPIDTEYPQERVNYILADTIASLVLSSHAQEEKFRNSNFSVICIDNDWDEVSKENNGDVQLHISSSQLAYVIYTSGSTGQPKGVLVEQCGVINLVSGQKRELNITDGTRVLQFASISFDASCVEIFTTLLFGGCLVMCKKETVLSAHLFQSLLSEHRVEIAILPPTFQQFIGDAPPPTLKTIVSAGEALDSVVAERLIAKGVRVLNGYGPTETTVCATLTDTPITNNGKITIGKPVDNTKVYLLNDQAQLVPIGVTGEICVGGIQVARGYLHRDELNAEKFIPDLFGSDQSGHLYRTGDLGRWMTDGNIEYLGRADNQVKIRGFRIELGEIENVLIQSGLVKHAIVIARPDKHGINQLIAYVTTNNDLNKHKLITYLSNRLPEYMIPTQWLRVERFLLTSSGKIDRRMLPDAEPLQAQTELLAGPRNDLEKALIATWTQFLEVKQLSIYDNFFELGGHSILAMRLIVAMRNQLNINVTVRDLFIYPSIAQLSQRIQTQQTDSYQSLIPIRAYGSKTPLYIVCGAGGTAFKFKGLVNFLDPDQPVYGVQQPLHITNPDEFPDTVEEIAKRYLSEIVSQNPDGPYALAGHCLGGIIAIEMVDQLQAMGKEVALLMMFDADAKPANRVVSAVSIPSLLKKAMGAIALKLKFEMFLLLKHPKQALMYKFRKIEPYLRDQDSRVANIDQQIFDKVTLKIKQATDKYVIKPYNGDIILFNATQQYYFVDNVNKIIYKEMDVSYEAKYAWGDYSQSIKIHKVQGEHSTIFDEKNAEELSNILQQYLNNTTKSNS